MDKNCHTILSYAVLHGHEKLDSMLLHEKLDSMLLKRDNISPDKRNDNNQLLLHCAAQNGQKEVVKIPLKSYNINSNKLDVTGDTLLRCTIINEHE